MATDMITGTTVLATYGVLITISLFMIIARFYLRIIIHETRRLLVSDLLMGAAWCGAVTTASFDVVYYKHGALSPTVDYTLKNYQADVDEFEYVAKMIWASVIPFYATLYLCKLSLVATYFQLFPSFMVKLRRALWATLGFCISAFLVSIGLQLFMCWPVQGNWKFSNPELLCDSAITEVIFQVGWVLHLIGSIAIFILPFFAIWDIQMRRAMKIGVYLVLLLGAVDIAFSLTRFLAVQLTSENDFRAITGVELWSALDMMIGLIVTCLPSLRPYLRRNFKASSASDSHVLHSNAIGVNESITVSRKVITSSMPWREHGEFEEITGDDERLSDTSGDVYHGHPVMIGHSVQVDGGRSIEHKRAVRDSLQEDRRSSKSDVELIQLTSTR